jgi:hypothetical protein
MRLERAYAEGRAPDYDADGIAGIVDARRRARVLGQAYRHGLIPDYAAHGIGAIRYQRNRLAVLATAYKSGLVPLHDPHVLGFRSKSMRACALCVAYKHGLRPDAALHAHAAYSECVGKRQTLSARARVLTAAVQHGMPYGFADIRALALEETRAALLEMAYRAGHFADRAHVSGPLTESVFIKFAARQADAARAVRMIVASRLGRDAGLLVLHHLVWFALRVDTTLLLGRRGGEDRRARHRQHGRQQREDAHDHPEPRVPGARPVHQTV